jgi:Ca-activated chloride channel family protein
MKKLRFVWLLAMLMLTAIACSGLGSGGIGTPASPLANKPANAIEISIIFAPESKAYLEPAIAKFNESYANGINPLSGQKLASGEKPVWVTGQSGSSGTVHQGIINALVAPNNNNTARPTIFAPSVSHWLALVNYQTGRDVFDLADSPPTALAPVVMAIWKSRYDAIQAKTGGTEVGWQELLQVMNSPNGWADYGIGGNRTTVYYGHTDPYVSSTGLSTLIGEFYASTLYTAGQQSRRLEMADVQNPAVQDGVRNIEALIKHYSTRTTEFKEYIAQGPEYLDFVALEENDLIYINQGKTTYKPPEPLVALYPKEGTFWHEHPFAIPNTDWVTSEQKAAAKVFTEYVRGVDVQKTILEAGFRPVNAAVPLAYPIVPELGVDPDQPATVLNVPDPAVIAAVQSSWQYVKKQGDILLVVDTSGSMDGDKIKQAREAANLFLERMASQNRIGLMEFSSQPSLIAELVSAENTRTQLQQQIDNLQADGDTALFDAILSAMDYMEQVAAGEEDRIQAILVLSDGQDTASTASLNDVVSRISAARSGRNPIMVIPIAYGGDADIAALNAIARASSTKVQSGNPEDILQLLELLSSFF